MESNNLDRKVKEALDKRSISPSAGNWEKLSQQLDLQEEKKKPTYFFWYGVSAGIAAMLVVGLFAFNFFSQSQATIGDTQPKEQIEEKTTPITNTQEAVVNTTPKDQSENKAIEIVENPTRMKTTIKKSSSSESVLAQHSTPKAFNKEQTLVDTLTSASVGIAQTNLVQEFQQSIIKEANTNAVSDAEIDALLANAMAELPQKKENTSYAQVNAKKLLQSVEVETEESFNNKVFEVFKEGFKTVRTAFIERND
ncbi:hypothetical protein GCM10009117_24470 [Gangjinia marincola]|uniref:Uncharacterized protein n=1 Tax=Gangjinia marincola TaxID=578463 RepID=A0ABN1MJ92_9FLAO